MSQSKVDVPLHISNQSPPSSSPETPNNPAPEPRRHRPKSLNLNPASPTEKSTGTVSSTTSTTSTASITAPEKNVDMALRIVSPGLPILNEEMETTVKISQKIELQQRNLIAARQAGSPSSIQTVSSGSVGGTATPLADSDSSKSNSPSRHNSDTSVNSVSSRPETATTAPAPPKAVHQLKDLDKLSAPASAKRLKRDNIPTPLTINPAGTSGIASSAHYRPAIQSAPIRHSSRLPVSSRYPGIPQRRYVSVPYPPQGVPASTPAPPPQVTTPYYQTGPHHLSPYQQFYPSPVQRRQFKPFPNAHVSYSSLHQGQPQPQTQPQVQPQPHQAQGPPNPGSTTPYRRYRMVAPHTTTSPYFPRGVRYARPGVQGQTPVTSSFAPPSASTHPQANSQAVYNTPGAEAKPFYVTDIYHGDLMKVAPFQSQPLSAQRDFFGAPSSSKQTPTSSSLPSATSQKNLIDEDRLPVSDDEVREMQEKYKNSIEEGRPLAHGHPGHPYSHPEHLPYPPLPQQYYRYQPQQMQSQQERISEAGEIFGSINLMNESIFNFKIFNQNPSSESERKDSTEQEVEDHAIEKEQQDEESPKEKDSEPKDKDTEDGEKSKSPSVSTKDSEEESNVDWLAKEKDKFLKICETSWDEFINSRKLASAW